MTAIFAYAAHDVAFVAADTLRVDPINLLPRMRVCKVHHWSDLVIFGQTGTQHLSRLIMDIKLEKRQFIDQATGIVYFDDSENWFFQTFKKCRPLQTQAPAAASANVPCFHIVRCDSGSSLTR
jgi:predicted phosphatase